MALWNKKPELTEQLGDPIINQMDAEMARNYAEAERIYREGLLPGGVINRRVTNSPAYSRPTNDVAVESNRMNMLAMRLRIKEGESLGFDSIHTSLGKGKEKVFVFVVQDDKPAVLEDDALMFPSDTLITQLRLICK